MIVNRLHTIGLLILLSLCIVTTHINADVAQQDYHHPAVRSALIIAGAATFLLVCSEGARLSSAIASLRLLKKLPLSGAMKQKIQAKIDYLEKVYYEWLIEKTKPRPDCVSRIIDTIEYIKLLWSCFFATNSASVKI